ncbi:MAG: nitrogen fixation protein NifM [Candidatus Thiodiazotropha endolucinida]|uniref:peptidylprolyl isomerase n=1 Tax=Candidatus Thiodiazotropha taylori TaxID=2792791 RepID=A0A9E4TSL2_9GAMM|nr:nitrogen fixation protein NifM [Candidatus Thiodiazotropha taylori]MCW4235944.1 nitrogen fixation protein NifM [Candidatus Thiodiazotropha endolucinida]
MILGGQQSKTSPEFNYHLLRNALERFGRNPGQLEPEEFQQVYTTASKSFELESLVLASPEAKGVIISEQQLDLSVEEVASRYANRDEYLQDLEANDLDEESLRQALYRELMFDSVLQMVAANSPDVSDIDVNLFYAMHQERFELPEQRQGRHILITVNPSFPENTAETVRERMAQILEKLAGRTNRFPEFAKRYSECPTAMEGGKLGEVKRGQLYPELDAVLFSMQENEISSIIASEMGYHILLCEMIKPAKRVPISKVKTKIREILEQRQRRNCQKAWLASLQKVSNA